MYVTVCLCIQNWYDANIIIYYTYIYEQVKLVVMNKIFNYFMRGKRNFLPLPSSTGRKRIINTAVGQNRS